MVIFDEDEWLMNIKGKKILIILLIIVLLIFLMIYFRPLSLLEKVNESNQIRIIMTEGVTRPKVATKAPKIPPKTPSSLKPVV